MNCKGEWVIMKIVQVAPDYITIPPLKYGGIERVVFDLTEELVRLGHEVYLYALPGSKTSATLIPYKHSQDAWEIARFVKETLPSGTNIVHDHTHGSVIGQTLTDVPCICSIHVPWCNYVKYPVFMSEFMKTKIGGGRGFVIPNGIQVKDYDFNSAKESYLFFMGRLIKSKGIIQAIDVAERTGKKLIIGGPAVDIVEPESYEFYKKDILPRIQSNTSIEYVGEVGGSERVNLLKKAECVLFPSDEEAFGLVLIEAMACGTPVLAFRKGAVPEVLGAFPDLVCENLDEMVHKAAVASFPAPLRMYEHVSKWFSSNLMAKRYLKTYSDVIQTSSKT